MPERTELVLFLFREVLQEQAADSLKVGAVHGLEGGVPLWREVDLEAAAVHSVTNAFDELALFEPVYQSAQSTEGQHGRLGEFDQPQLTFGGAGEFEQHFIFSEGDLVGVLHVLVEAADQGGIGAQEQTPGVSFGAAEEVRLSPFRSRLWAG
ncbi:hypothetical protein GCM10008955_36450 [Deinococcus malanensis]|uniref:Uncharacterized protein n=1 Tax=Deinococcus malanensis TaxID=1706855 RepID=A0ABQ2F0W4_9DEIO|nr:hypothetical protein GCM10008955_36450 [Deinococcus malanensis]